MRNRVRWFIAFFVLNSAAYAGISKPPIRYSFLYNTDIRHTEENFYHNRLESIFKRVIFSSNRKSNVILKAAPFIEFRYNQERRRQERVSMGIELGVEPLKFLYIGENFRWARRSEEVFSRGVIDNVTSKEGLTIITLTANLVPGKDLLKGYLSGEYTYDFEEGSATRMESLGGILINPDQPLSFTLGWRHRDRIHESDCDTVEAGCSFVF